MARICLVVILVVLPLCLAKVDKADQGKTSDQNNQVEKQDKDLLGEGSADYYYYDDDDEDKDDEYSYYDYGHEGSGFDGWDDQELLKFEQEVANNHVDTKKKNQKKDDDITFDDHKSSQDQDDLLYEYDNEIYEEDYADSADRKPVETFVPQATEPDQPSADEESLFELSYLYILLASALVSFALFLLLFLVCRRTLSARAAKRSKNVPFVVSDHHQFMSKNVYGSSPIVKNYQRVPTKESALNMNYDPNEKPLLN